MWGALGAYQVCLFYLLLDLTPGTVFLSLLLILGCVELGFYPPLLLRVERRRDMGVRSVLRSVFGCTRARSGLEGLDVVDPPTESMTIRSAVWGDQPQKMSAASSPIEAARGAFLEDSVASFSRGGLMVSMDGRVIYKTNQDRGLVAHPTMGRSDQAIFGIFDGHGENGEHVASYTAMEIPLRLGQHMEIEDDPTMALKDVYQDISSSLPEAGIHAVFGGATAVVVLARGRKLWVANAGDSRAIVATRGREGDIVGRALTWDQNPNSPGERERIEAAGGFVSDPEEEGASSRVWLDATKSMVGLAMARSIGDLAVKQVGVIAEPEVTEYNVTERDEFLLLASDGIWEFISNQEAAEVVQGAMDQGHGAAGACKRLMELANCRWADMVGDYRDDITATVVRLPFLPPAPTEVATAEAVAAAVAIAAERGTGVGARTGEMGGVVAPSILDEPEVVVAQVAPAPAPAHAGAGALGVAGGVPSGRALKAEEGAVSTPPVGRGSTRRLTQLGAGLAGAPGGEGSTATEALFGHQGGENGVEVIGVRAGVREEAAEVGGEEMELVESVTTATPSVTPEECPSEGEEDGLEVGSGTEVMEGGGVDFAGMGGGGGPGGVGGSWEEETKRLLVVVSGAGSPVAGEPSPVITEGMVGWGEVDDDMPSLVTPSGSLGGLSLEEEKDQEAREEGGGVIEAGEEGWGHSKGEGEEGDAWGVGNEGVDEIEVGDHWQGVRGKRVEQGKEEEKNMERRGHRSLLEEEEAWTAPEAVAAAVRSGGMEDGVLGLEKLGPHIGWGRGRGIRVSRGPSRGRHGRGLSSGSSGASNIEEEEEEEEEAWPKNRNRGRGREKSNSSEEWIWEPVSVVPPEVEVEEVVKGPSEVVVATPKALTGASGKGSLEKPPVSSGHVSCGLTGSGVETLGTPPVRGGAAGRGAFETPPISTGLTGGGGAFEASHPSRGDHGGFSGGRERNRF